MSIYVNEVGYFVKKKKYANVVNANAVTLYKDNKEIKNYTISNYQFDKLAGEDTAIVDFSDINDEGSYYFVDDKGNKSCSFIISENPYNELETATLKMFYFQRCGCALEEKYAGKYTHKPCHIKPVKYIYGDSEFDCSGGWHDAGDFGRYVTAGAVAVAHLLYAFLINENAFTKEINIPESGNGIPDVLNEARYELEWMLKMQTEDGGVYHKCTSMKHADFLMPEKDQLPFITTPVSSLATADFAAVAALASRVYKKYDSAFATKLERAAMKASIWLEINKGLSFEEAKGCTTGGYGDMCDVDERLWAATELYRIDKGNKFISQINAILDMNINTTSMGWMDVGGLAAMCVLTGDNVFPEAIYDHFKTDILDEADRLVNTSKKNTYKVAMHPYNFKWGSNMVLLNGAMVLCLADRLANEEAYKDSILYQLDYLLGRNALNISYVTGFGDNSFKNPHNRPTASDGIAEPIPGYVSGGPNKDFCDEDAVNTIKPGTAPMKCYADIVGSYSTNEITIYWNSPLVFILACIHNK